MSVAVWIVAGMRGWRCGGKARTNCTASLSRERSSQNEKGERRESQRETERLREAERGAGAGQVGVMSMHGWPGLVGWLSGVFFLVRAPLRWLLSGSLARNARREAMRCCCVCVCATC